LLKAGLRQQAQPGFAAEHADDMPVVLAAYGPICLSQQVGVVDLVRIV
jgi:hypothetical protein